MKLKRINENTTELYYLDKLVGVYKRDTNTFIKQISEANIFSIYKGVGISYRILEHLRRINCNKIIIIIHGSNSSAKYYTTVFKYMEEGITYNNGLDYQKILPIISFDNKHNEYNKELATFNKL